ncbi:BTAD domain-containing putative transcriptional regulator [Actinoplanes sp. NPDC049802]|uniref:BTAD domain-containing putative transcriptional regulator n=1 Tax=Actinoplanes sp. NPDC049802 TaxID=3154742 RepID=UPI00340AEEAA
MPQVAVAVLGPTTATLDGAPADIGGPRQRAVLARLAAAGGDVVSTDRLIHDLRGDGDPAKALAVLQVHVSHLRRALEPGRARRAPARTLISRPPGYALSLPVTAVDAWHFDDLVRRAATVPPAERLTLLGAALSGWRGTAYAEVADEPWAVPEVARLTELRLSAVESRAETELALGRTGAAIADLERHLRHHPGREEAVRLLALALYRAGRQGDALGVLRRARAHLAEELGVDPGPALRALEADVLAQAEHLSAPVFPGLTAAAGERPALVAGERPHLVAGERPALVAGERPGERPALAAGERPVVVAVGREPELAAIASAAEEAERSGARIVWIGGEAGLGKSTLAEAAASNLAGHGWRVAHGRCPEVEGAPPGWPWSETLTSLGAADPLTGPEWPSPFRLGQAVAATLGAGGPTVVVLDDLHRADDLTLQVLRQAVDRLAARPVLALATYRTAEVGDELGATIGALLARTAGHLLPGGLDAAAVAGLAAEHGLRSADPALISRLTERTGGNPLFVRELARLIVAVGPSAADTAVPAGVREVLRRRVARLPDGATTALRQAAVLGRDVDVEMLAEMAGRDADDLLDALETAILAGLLDEPAPGLVRFAHALVRDTLYEDTPLLRRARLHGSALDVLERRGADAATLARHAVASAGAHSAYRAVPYVIDAAREAERAGAWGEAARHRNAALRLHELAGRRTGAVSSGGPGELLDVLVPAVTALARAGDAAGARTAYLRAVAVAGPLGRAVEPLTAWDAPLIWTVREGPPDPDVLAALDAETNRPEISAATRARLLIARFRELEGADDAAAIRISGEALAHAREAGEPRLLCAALNVRAYATLGPDLRDERRAAATEYLRVAVAAGELDHEAVAHWLLFLETAARTELDGALDEMRLALARSDTGRLGVLLTVLSIFSGLLDLIAGRVDEAVARYEEVARLLTEHGAVNGALMAMVGRIGAGVARGDLSPVRPELEAVQAAFPGEVTEPLVLALLDDGREEQARREWATRRPVSRGYYWLGWTALRARAAARLGDLSACAEAYAELLPFAGRLAGPDSGTLYAGPVDEALAMVAETLGEPEAAARHRAAAGELLARARASRAVAGQALAPS